MSYSDAQEISSEGILTLSYALLVIPCPPIIWQSRLVFMIFHKLANYSHSHFTDKETETRRLSDLPKVTELVSVKIEAGAHVIFPSQPCCLSY